jgi:hypothetical protein
MRILVCTARGPTADSFAGVRPDIARDGLLIAVTSITSCCVKRLRNCAHVQLTQCGVTWLTDSSLARVLLCSTVAKVSNCETSGSPHI